jgi:hypothetical protein
MTILARRSMEHIARRVRIRAYQLGKLGLPRCNKQDALDRALKQDFPAR